MKRLLVPATALMIALAPAAQAMPILLTFPTLVFPADEAPSTDGQGTDRQAQAPR